MANADRSELYTVNDALKELCAHPNRADPPVSALIDSALELAKTRRLEQKQRYREAGGSPLEMLPIEIRQRIATNIAGPPRELAYYHGNLSLAMLICPSMTVASRPLLWERISDNVLGRAARDGSYQQLVPCLLANAHHVRRLFHSFGQAGTLLPALPHLTHLTIDAENPNAVHLKRLLDALCRSRAAHTVRHLTVLDVYIDYRDGSNEAMAADRQHVGLVSCRLLTSILRCVTSIDISWSGDAPQPSTRNDLLAHFSHLPLLTHLKFLFSDKDFEGGTYEEQGHDTMIDWPSLKVLELSFGDWSGPFGRPAIEMLRGGATHLRLHAFRVPEWNVPVGACGPLLTRIESLSLVEAFDGYAALGILRDLAGAPNLRHIEMDLPGATTDMTLHEPDDPKSDTEAALDALAKLPALTTVTIAARTVWGKEKPSKLRALGFVSTLRERNVVVREMPTTRYR